MLLLVIPLGGVVLLPVSLFHVGRSLDQIVHPLPPDSVLFDLLLEGK